MYLTLSMLLLSGRFTLAAKWAIDGSCDLVPIADPGHGLAPFLQATDELKKAMKEGITMAENAFNVMNDHKDDQHVANMLKLVLGEGSDYQAKFQAVKKTFEDIKGFDKEHAEHRPLDQGWQDTMTSNDVMIFCTSDRIQRNPYGRLRRDISMRNRGYMNMEFDEDTVKGMCHTTNYDVENIDGKTMAYTTSSDFFNKAGYLEANQPKSTRDFTSPSPNIAFAIDFCRWFLHKSLQQGWPRIEKDRIERTQQPDFKGGIKEYATPVDGLRNTGMTVLHEGGRLTDSTQLPPGTPECYGWKCIQDLKNPTNSDNVAMLGLALHLWTMGYYVDKDGNVNNK